jgi:cytochrome c551/c552
MKKVIKPTMGKLFTAYDGAKYGDFGCKTCHGPNNDDPQKVLPKITLSGNGFQKLSADKPAIMKFMTEQVTPAMATAMGEPPFNPATHKGFGCGGCHTVN